MVQQYQRIVGKKVIIRAKRWYRDLVEFVRELRTRYHIRCELERVPEANCVEIYLVLLRPKRGPSRPQFICSIGKPFPSLKELRAAFWPKYKRFIRIRGWYGYDTVS